MTRSPIIAAMCDAALASAAECAREQAAFADRLHWDGIALVLDDLAEWIDVSDGARLEAAGIVMHQTDDGRLVFRSPRRNEPFIIRVYSARALSAGGKIVPVNPDLAVLEAGLYGDLVNRLLDWFGISPAGRETGHWGG